MLQKSRVHEGVFSNIFLHLFRLIAQTVDELLSLRMINQGIFILLITSLNISAIICV